MEKNEAASLFCAHWFSLKKADAFLCKPGLRCTFLTGYTFREFCPRFAQVAPPPPRCHQFMFLPLTYRDCTSTM